MPDVVAVVVSRFTKSWKKSAVQSCDRELHNESLFLPATNTEQRIFPSDPTEMKAKYFRS